MSTPTVFVHLSDLHLVAPGDFVSGVDSYEQTRAVLERIRGLDVAPSFVIVSGDLSNDGSAESYAVFHELAIELAGGDTPLLLALGNHDDRATFRRVVLGEMGDDGRAPHCHSRLIDGLQVVVLDSSLPGEASGALGAAQLAWLAEQLATPAPRGTIIVLHHCCRLLGPAHHFPDFILQDVAELEALVARHQGEILGVLAGHSHQANAAPFGGAIYTTAPAVLCQLDFFNGDDYTPIAQAGFNLCQIVDGQLLVNPVLVHEGG